MLKGNPVDDDDQPGSNEDDYGGENQVASLPEQTEHSHVQIIPPAIDHRPGATLKADFDPTGPGDL